MLSAITSRSNLTDTVAPLRRPSSASFNAALDKATTANMSFDTASISDTAKLMSARPATPQFGSDYFNNFPNMTRDELKKQIAKDADAISSSQGLPSGKYNFKSLTPGQAEVVLHNLGMNLGVKTDDLLAISGNLGRMSYDDFTPHDMTEGLAESAAFERSSGNAAGAALMEGSLAVIAKFSEKSALPDPTKLYQSLLSARVDKR